MFGSAKLLVAAVCAAMAIGANAQTKTVRIAWADPLSGPMAPIGQMELDGWRQAIELANNDYTAMATIILEGLGGKENVVSIDHCITRLRLEVKDRLQVNEAKIKASGAAGVLRPGKTSVQVIIGPKVQFVYDELKKML